MDEMVMNLENVAEAAETVAEVAEKAVEAVSMIPEKKGVLLPTGGAIALGVAGITGGGFALYLGARKAAALIKDFREYRKAKKNGAVAPAEDAKIKGDDGKTESAEADVVETKKEESAE